MSAHQNGSRRSDGQRFTLSFGSACAIVTFIFTVGAAVSLFVSPARSDTPSCQGPSLARVDSSTVNPDQEY